MNDFLSTSHYYLQSAKTSVRFEDVDWILEPREEKEPSLLRSVFRDKQLQLNSEENGLFRFSNWMPVHHTLPGSYAPVTYRSEGLARHLGLENLYITFNGYWPERKIRMRTCSFKEVEAYSVCARLNSLKDKILVVASAGNTARSFARVCSDNDIPVIIFVPELNFSTLWFDEPLKDCVKLVAVSGGDYFDAINLSNQICDRKRYLPEGGVKNAARRDGMGTTVLSAATFIGQIPDYYFQAIGSGSGAIAAWEANSRLLQDGRFGSTKMKLMVSQNKPFTPIYHAWKAGSRELDFEKIEEEKNNIPGLFASVLSNRRPAYSMHGGLYDALIDTGGDVLAVNNSEAEEASQLFEETEGIDIHPAAAVATASLARQVREGALPKDARIMLNVTGGGEQRLRQDKKVYDVSPHVTVPKDTPEQELRKRLESVLSF